ncbi:MAG: formylglycine-generating enzyme family protein, partial [Candidatus Omnitrophica bacterium]|nr:formylglycine-generating enzyme family protein [Candidatus Omnitrophota bacterium]
RHSCTKLTDQERTAGRLPAGYVYRLPTEAEWEYATRAGTTTRFYYGDDPGYASLSLYAWYSEDSGSATHPVGTKLPNAWGLFDMHGNVWEWCSDWYSEYYSPSSVTDPKGPATGTLRVVRGGGALADFGSGCRSAVRDGTSPSSQLSDLGFRVVLGKQQSD